MSKIEEVFRVAISYTGFDERGVVSTMKQENLVSAVNYTDAEAIACDLMKALDGDADYTIVKNKVNEMIVNEELLEKDKSTVSNMCLLYLTGDESTSGFFEVKYEYPTVTDSGKEKMIKGAMIVVEENAQKAYQKTLEYMENNEIKDCMIKSVKFDKASGLVADEMLINELLADSK